MLSAAHIWLCSDQSSVRGHEAEGSVQHLGSDAAVREHLPEMCLMLQPENNIFIFHSFGI